MKFSIIIPAHNAEKTILTAIDSVLNQTYADYETIIILDSCTDDTKKYVRRPYYEVNEGSPGGARNAGLKVAKGDYVLFLDADDRFYTPYALELIEQNIKNIDILHFGFIWGNLYASVNGNNNQMWCNVWSRAWKRTAIGETIFNHKKTEEDFDFCNEIFKKKLNHAILEMPLIWYTPPHEGSLTWEAQNGNSNNNIK